MTRTLCLSALLSLLYAPAAAAQFSTGNLPTAPGVGPLTVDSGDLDGDEDPDLLTANVSSGDLTFYENTAGTFAFAGTITPTCGFGISNAVIADLDGSAGLDVVASLTGSSDVLVALSSGYPTFVQTCVPTGSNPIHVIALDLDRDGDQDIAALHAAPPSISLLRNNGSGVFVVDSVVALTGLAQPSLIEEVDVNKGTSDLAVTKIDGSIELVLMASPPLGPIVVGVQQVFPIGAYLHGVTGLDANCDGIGDLAVVDHGSNTLKVMINDGPSFGGWPTSVNFTTTTFPLTTPQTAWAIEDGDFDCDGDTDLAITFRSLRMVEIQLGDGSGGFTYGNSYLTGDAPLSIVADDYDSNAYADLAISNANTNNITLLTNQNQGICCHELRGGIDDGLSTAMPPVGPEDACPSAALSAFASPCRDFDDASPPCDRCFAHSFEDLPDGILSAELEIYVSPSCGLASNDGFSMGYDAGVGQFAWGSRISSLRGGTPAWTAGPIVLDLANLPGGGNLLPKLNCDGFLDLYIQDDTEVDYAILRLETCCPSTPGVVPKGECEAELDQDPLVTGLVTTFTLTNLPVTDLFGIYLYSLTGLGDSFLSLTYPGLCLLPGVTILGISPAAAGTSSLASPMPNFPSCFPVHTQGLGFPSFEFTNTISSPIFD